MKNITHCPICNQKEFKEYLEASDYTVSMESFKVVECANCGFHFTNPVPEEDKIGEYYKSESYISHSSTNKGLINKLYQVVRKYTLKQKLKLVKKESKGNELLDIGSATGHFLNVCKEGGFNVSGLEPDEDARSFAKNEFGIQTEPIERLHELEDNSVDVITMWHVLEHVYHLRRDLDKITSVLKDDGVLIVAVPNMNSYDAKKYGAYWAAWDLPIHLYHFGPKDIDNLFEQYDMKADRILPMKFDAFYVSMLSEKYKGGNLISAFLTGLKSNWQAKSGTYSSQIYILRKKRN